MARSWSLDRLVLELGSEVQEGTDNGGPLFSVPSGSH